VTSKKNAEPAVRLSAADKLANVAALLLVKGMNQGDSIVTLTRAGFPVSEIANLLDATPGFIGQTNYMARKGKTKRKAPKPK
jgi:hypothetical protein